MAKVLQINLQRCRLALDLLLARNRDYRADIVLVSEQYHSVSGPNWLCDPSGTAAIWVPELGRFSVKDSGSRDGIVWASTPAVSFVSCYFTPNEPIADFRKRVDDLERVIRHLEGEIVIGGDFNAKSIVWGMEYSDTWGNELLDMMESLDLVIVNRGNTPTFGRCGVRDSILDLTFATQRIAGVISDWVVLEEYTASDHQYISYSVHNLEGKPRTVPERRMERIGWKVSRIDEGAFQKAVSDKIVTSPDLSVKSREDVERLVGRLMDAIVAGCDASMPRRSAGSRRKPVYWWTDEIALLRTECLRLRRKALRSRKRSTGQQRNDEYKAAKKRLVMAIKASKERRWKAICKEVDDDLWGNGYRIVTQKFVGRSPVAPMEPHVMEKIVRTLFPDHEERVYTQSVVSDDECPRFSAAELRNVIGCLKGGKAPGPDGIPVEVYKVLMKQHGQLLLDTYNACIRAGIFPKRWKLQRLVLLDKGKGSAYTPSSYRPLCMRQRRGRKDF
ncbi:unnamed protein product [Euphydryas editha]|uniref:Endonuclease/exonuclease/phosphatase domain-containing protein n=1 Tax=Euphydryas editha TaxID=104508 RepID=A0AAU9U557_EUPED|nr:unnamed protein product [Euphydryas editha]